jgi:hypothetical protein
MLNALAFPSNGFGGVLSYGSRYLMQALPLLMLALLPLDQTPSPARARAPNQLLGISAVVASLAFQLGALPPSPKLVQDPSEFLLSAPATLFPLEDSLLPWIPIFASDFRTDNEAETISLFYRDAHRGQIRKYVNGKVENQLTLYQHDAEQALPAFTINSSVHAKVSIKNGTDLIWTGSISPLQAQALPLDDSFFQHSAFDLIDQKTKRWGTFTIELQTTADQDKPAYASFDLNDQVHLKPIPINRNINVHEFQALGIISRFHWSHIEDWGTWTDGEYAELLFLTPNSFSGPAEIRLEVQGYTPKEHPQQNIEVFLNGERQFDLALTKAETTTLSIPIDCSAAGTPIALGFRIRNSLSPLELGISHDNRALGLGLLSLRLASEPDIQSGTP